MRRNIKRVAVLGSGVMGSRIACHFANVGVAVELLDIVPRELDEKEKAKGLTLEDQSVRNRLVNGALTAALKSNPSPIYDKKFAKRIRTGNFEDHMSRIADCDWIIEVVVERLDIKKIVFEQVEQHRKPGSLISSNTSGIPMALMIDGRSDDFKKHFCGTHFFNPPRYLPLLEIIPSKETDPAVIDFHMNYGAKFLGKKTVLCKDTPAFIANRVGVFSIQALFHLVKEMGLTIEEVDKLTGPAMGRPKSATFRTCDVVGLDTLVHVANGVRENCPNDERKDVFEIPGYVQKMVENGWLGSKSKQGFYKKVKDENGKSEILVLDLESMEYRSKNKVKFPTLELTKAIDNLAERTKVLYNGQDKAGEFYRKSLQGLFLYVANRIPEISDELYRIDDAIKAGFGWEIGAFESWDAIGVDQVIKDIEATGQKPAEWVYEMKAAGIDSFYSKKDGNRYYYDIPTKAYKVIPGQEDIIKLSNIDDSKIVWQNKGVTLKDLGDGILNAEFHTKMNTIGQDILTGLNKAIDIAEKDYKGLVISNEGQNFSAGANVGMIFMMAVEQEWDELDMAIRLFQNATSRMRFSSVPVVCAPHNMALGGGCELAMHCDKVVAHAELYMGLVEFGVGLIPGGGGTKEFALRLSDELDNGNIRINQFRQRFLTIGQAQVSTSAYEAFDKGYLREGIDEVVVSRDHQLARAKEACLELFENGYTQPQMREDVKVLGQEALGIVYVGADSMKSGHYISEHDKLISEKLGFVLAGGDLSMITEVSEQYLLDLERKKFLELCTEKKTLERIQSIIQTGKVLRN